MSRRGIRAGLCALAAVAFFVAAFLPWFESARGAPRDTWSESSARAVYQLHGGERCERGRCRDVAYSGRPGVADDLFAALGWTTLAGCLATASLALVTAGSRRSRRRHGGWAATAAAITVAAAAMFIASQTLSEGANLVRAWGLTFTVIGAITLGIGVGLPDTGGVPMAPARAWGAALALAAGALVAWASLVDHGWWRATATFDQVTGSPLGLEVCDGPACRIANRPQDGAGYRLLAWLTVGAAAATLVPATIAAVRTAMARAAGTAGLAAALVATGAAVVGAGCALGYPGQRLVSVDWGVPGFALGMAAVIVGALASRRWCTVTDVDATPAPAPSIAPTRPAAVAPARPPLAPTGVSPLPGARPPLAPRWASPPPGPRPPLPPLATSAPLATTAPAGPRRPTMTATTTAPAAAGPGRDLGRRAPPRCPGCGQSTLWHGKRTAWWCSACKRVL